MKKQIIFIHGGDLYSEYDLFLDHLRTCELRNVLEDPPKRWKNTLRAELGHMYDVYMPSMPNSDNAKYIEWKILFERYIALMHTDVVFVGHSLGGYFLAKYLIEEELPIQVHALFLIAAPIRPDDFGGEDGGDFDFDISKLSLIEKKTEKVFILHSKDDPIVPYTHAKEYVKALPTATFISFEDRGHFLTETFPELIEQLKDLKMS